MPGLGWMNTTEGQMNAIISSSRQVELGSFSNKTTTPSQMCRMASGEVCKWLWSERERCIQGIFYLEIWSLSLDTYIFPGILDPALIQL